MTAEYNYIVDKYGEELLHEFIGGNTGTLIIDFPEEVSKEDHEAMYIASDLTECGYCGWTWPREDMEHVSECYGEVCWKCVEEDINVYLHD